MKESEKLDAIVIMDFGGQYCHLIGRRIRGLGVYTEIIPYDVSIGELMTLRKNMNVKGIILSGGPSSVYEENAPVCDSKIFSLEIPLLGLCYGHQLIAQMFGGRVQKSRKREYGRTRVYVDKAVGVLDGLKRREEVWMSHGDSVHELPLNFEGLAHTDNSPIAAFRNSERDIHGLQWHPEVSHTSKGIKMLRNFVFSICRCKPGWGMGSFIERAVAEIKESVGEGRCILALSGGVDSSTTAVLTARAVGKRLTAVFVDHGFMRLMEPETIRKTFNEFDLNLVSVDVKRTFLGRLQEIRDPEEKRRIIGSEFIRAFEREAEKIGADYLIQGTIYPDRIESGFKKGSEKIKTHHNVGGIPTKIRFKAIVEPLRDLYKDEVREVAELLGLPSEIVWRQPFPGPGLAVRVVGEVTEEKLKIVKAADAIVTEEIERSGLDEALWQYFAIVTDSKSTGVKGDSRAYGYTIAIRAVESIDGMTATFAKIPYEILDRMSTRITNEIPQIIRVAYDISNKPPATIEWE